MTDDEREASISAIAKELGDSGWWVDSKGFVAPLQGVIGEISRQLEASVKNEVLANVASVYHAIRHEHSLYFRDDHFSFYWGHGTDDHVDIELEEVVANYTEAGGLEHLEAALVGLLERVRALRAAS